MAKNEDPVKIADNASYHALLEVVNGTSRIKHPKSVKEAALRELRRRGYKDRYNGGPRNPSELARLEEEKA